MNIAILSGKGGTGKTTVATNLASYLNSKGYKTQYLDYDVEEPNGFIFLKPQIEETIEVKVKVPKIDESLCNGCGKCAKSCRFNALAASGGKVIVFEKLCHSCGLCSMVCPNNAITEVDREIGTIEMGRSDQLIAVRGTLNIGEPMGVPIIKKLKEFLKENYINIIDAPPGSSCSVVNSVEGSDYSILVTEPTRFGLHDLNIAVEVVKQMGIPFGIVINKSNEDDYLIEEYCRNKDIQIIGRIPFDKSIAQKYSKGELLTGNPMIYEALQSISSSILEVD